MNEVKPKRVLIISYYWPPAGGPGVQRWLKFVKYLPGCGWQPVVYTPENPEMPSEDPSLLADVPISCEVIKTPIREPYSVYKKLVGLKPSDRIQTGFLNEKKKAGWKEHFARFVRGNFFIPDARLFWIKPSVRYLKIYLKKHPVDLIVSSGPPHSMHLIARALRRDLGIPWIADFRDPWTNIDFYEELHLTAAADRKHHRLETSVLEEADRILVVGETMKREFSEKIAPEKIFVVPNGFDRDDLPAVQAEADPFFSIAHIGSFSPARNVPALWQALAELAQNSGFRAKLRIKVVGKLDHSVRQSIEDAGLLDCLLHIPYLPHDEVIVEQQKSHVLLLVVNNTKNAQGIVTGKVFEYMAAQRPILAIGPEDGDLAEILIQSGFDAPVEYTAVETLKTRIAAYYASAPAQQKKVTIEKFDRRNLTAELASFFELSLPHE